MSAPRIALISALQASIEPIESSFRRLWPEAVRMNLLDDSLSADVAAAGELTAAMYNRFLALGRYAKMTGVDGILFTCSAFGACIDAVKEDLAPLPVFKPNEAMIAEAVKIGRRIGLLSTFAPTLQSMPAEFPKGVEVVPALAAGALEALAENPEAHDEIAAAVCERELSDCDVIALAQFSLARARGAIAKRIALPVLTTPDLAVIALRGAIEARRDDAEIAMTATKEL